VDPRVNFNIPAMHENPYISIADDWDAPIPE